MLLFEGGVSHKLRHSTIHCPLELLLEVEPCWKEWVNGAGLEIWGGGNDGTTRPRSFQTREARKAFPFELPLVKYFATEVREENNLAVF